jgi:hypothetical protein
MDNRLGGIFILLGSASLPFIIIEYVLISQNFPGVSASMSDLGSYYEKYYADLSRGWKFEMLAMALLGAGALVRTASPARAGWALTAIGVALVLPMYAAMIGGYGAIINQEPFDLNAYRLILGFASSVFDGGNVIVSFGIALALFQEAKLARTEMPVWLLYSGAIAQFAAGLGFTIRHFGGDLPLSIMGMPALFGFIVVAIMGAYISFGKTKAEG